MDACLHVFFLPKDEREHAFSYRDRQRQKVLRRVICAAGIKHRRHKKEPFRRSPMPRRLSLVRLSTLAIALSCLVPPMPVLAQADPLPAISPASAGFSEEGLQRIDRFFEREVAANRIPG